MEKFERAVDTLGISFAAYVLYRKPPRAFALAAFFVLVVSDVLWNFDQSHALGRRYRFAERRAQVELDRGPVGHALGKLLEAAHYLRTIGFLERTQVIFGVGMLPGNTNHCATSQTGDTKPRNRVGKPASGRYQTNPYLAGHARVSIRGVRGRLLMAHVNHLDLVVPEVGQNRKQMATVDRKTVLHLVLAHHPRSYYTPVYLGHDLT